MNTVTFFFWMRLVFLIPLGYSNCFALSSAPQTLVVTCATGELGSATARLLACDHHLILTGRNLSTLEQLQKELKAENPWNYEICTLDYASSSSIARFKDRLNQLTSPISGLVLITPRPQFYGKVLLQEEDAWLEVFRNTFTGPLEALSYAASSVSAGKDRGDCRHHFCSVSTRSWPLHV
jgi:NAD(P)-dependent dehydrogenase (short-subunit alcohol dehydrogenase family)